jgi:leader peptidase (prepilin peptidase)/N-methyltransferase
MMPVPRPWIIAVAAALGAAMGSFLNVVISRVPRGESIVHPPSRCPGCGRRLEWWENVPVAGYAFLRGKCRTCRAPIGLRHLMVELAGAFVAGGVAWILTRSWPAGEVLANG